MQGDRVLYRETQVLLGGMAEAVGNGTRKLPLPVAEDLLEIIMRWYERTSALRRALRLSWGLAKRV